MKRKFATMGIVIFLIGILAGCACEHEYDDATCTEASKCTLCGETQGEPLGHDYKEATCTEASECRRCGETEGEALGHDYKEATCTEASECRRCGETEGESLGHTTDIGKCSNCGELIGVNIILSISDDLSIANDYISSAISTTRSANTNSTSDCYSKFIIAASSYDAAEGYLISARNACGDYSELSTLKNYLNAAIRVLPTSVAGSDTNSLVDYLYQSQDFSTKIALVFDEIGTICDDF